MINHWGNHSGNLVEVGPRLRGGSAPSPKRFGASADPLWRAKDRAFPENEKRSERGYALILLMLVVLVLAITSFSFLSLAGQRAIWQRGHSNSQGAFLAAESGIDLVLALANEGYFGSDDQLLPLDPPANPGDNLESQDVLIGDNIFDEDENPLEFPEVSVIPRVEVFRLADDVIDENTMDRILRAESVGTVGQNSRRVIGFLRSRETIRPLIDNLPVVESAVMLAGPPAEVRFNGNNFLILGEDKNIDETPGSCDDVFGIGVGNPGNPQDAIVQLRPNRYYRITGQGEYPSVASVDEVSVQSVIDALCPFADVTPEDPGKFSESLGTYDKPKLACAKEDVKISGGGEGFGILLVQGKLEITGRWDYVGLIFVNGEVIFSGGGGGKRLTGAIFVEWNGQEDENRQESLRINGTIDIQYSCEAIDLVTDYLDTIPTTTPYTLVASAEAGLTGE